MFTRVNRGITCPQVRVTNEEGEQLGIMSTNQAQDLANQSGLDLVEIAPKENPPVCRIMDFGKFRFEQKKKIKDQKAKTKSIKPKAIRLRPVSGEHDIEHKVEQLKKFLIEKHTVSVNVIFKNRELMFKDQGKKIIEQVISAVQDVGQVESPPKFEGKQLSVRLRPK